MPPFYFHFSFDFGDPVFEFEALRFAFRIFTPSNVYGLDPSTLSVERRPDRLKILASSLTWAGGQERCDGKFEALIENNGDAIEWEAHVRHAEPVKSVATLVDGLPFGRVAPCQQDYLPTQGQELVRSLRQRHPHLLVAGEAWYDAVLGLFPICQTIPPPLYPQFISRYIRAVAHLRHPAPGRGSTGVHEQGFRGFNRDSLELNPNQIPTLAIVDDSFEKHRDVIEAIIAKAKAQVL